MLYKKLIFLFTLLYSSAFTLNKPVETSPIEWEDQCAIHSREYLYEYLYASNERACYKELCYNNTFMCPINMCSPPLDRIKWIFRKLNSSNFLTIASQYDRFNFFCASYYHWGLFRQRRKVFIKHTRIPPPSNCYWRIKQIGTRSLYHIWNTYFNELLYAPNFFFKDGKNKRNIFLWKNTPRSLSGRKYEWFIDCDKDNLFNYLLRQ